MTDPDLRGLIARAGQPEEALDLTALRRRIGRRRRRRVAGRAMSSLVAAAVVILGGQSLLGNLGEDAPVQLAGRAEGLVQIDPDVDVLEGLAPLPGAAAATEPTRLPDGYRRCSAPTSRAAVSITQYCAEGRPTLSLARGPHYALPEVGERYQVASRIGYLRRHEGLSEMTVSDANSEDDRHYRLTVIGDPDADVADLVGILASIPTVAEAPPPTDNG